MDPQPTAALLEGGGGGLGEKGWQVHEACLLK